MKITGSKGYADSLFGGKGIDLIYGNGGGDLISAWMQPGQASRDKVYAGAGDDLISGFSVDFSQPSRSGSRGAFVNGGSGDDMLIIDSASKAKNTDLGRLDKVIDVTQVEEIIYNFSGATSKQKFTGTNTKETIYIGENGSTAYGGRGNDYLFAGSGDDTLVGGDGNDFLSAAGGRNTLTGGKGADYFQFHLTQDYSYSNITDFQKGVDKIALVIDLLDYEYEGETFGDDLRLITRGMDAMKYLDYDRGRVMDRGLFSSNSTLFTDNMIYERETGSFIQRVYIEEDDGIVEYQVLLAHLENKPNLDVNDFVFMFY